MDTQNDIKTDINEQLEDVFRENEMTANRLNLYVHCGIVIVAILLVSCYSFGLPADEVSQFEDTRRYTFFVIPWHLMALLCGMLMNTRGPAFKYVLMGLWAASSTTVVALLGCYQLYFLFFSIAASVRYFRPRMTLLMTVVMLPLCVLAMGINVMWGVPDVAMLDLPEGTIIRWTDDAEKVFLAAHPDRWESFINVMQWRFPLCAVFMGLFGWMMSYVAHVGRRLVDLQARRNLEGRMSQVEKFNREIAGYLVNHGDNNDELGFVAQRLIDFLGCDLVSIHRRQEKQVFWRENGACGGLGSACEECPLNSPDYDAFYDERGMLNLPDVSRSKMFASCKGCKARSVLSCQLVFNGRQWGNITVHYMDHVHEFMGDERHVLRLTADLLVRALERNELNRHLMQERDTAISAEKSKSQFFANVSHDIRTPLNAILGFSELLRQGVPDVETEHKYLDSIAFSGNTLLMLINDVLDLSKMEAGKMKYAYEMTNFQDIGDKLLQTFQLQAEKKGLTLKAVYAEGFPQVKIDPQRVRQILFNLIGNAMKFTDKGGITLDATFTPGDDDKGTLEFAVIDTGRGISGENIQRLMQPFVQIQAQDQANGAGLGLSICKTMLKQMDGKLEIESLVGSGSTFKVTLYHVEYSNEAPVPVEEAPSDETMFRFLDHAQELPTLIVDDSPVNIAVLKAMLTKIGLRRILTAANGKLALEVLQKEAVSLVLTDMWMPEMNGVELVAAIRKDPKLEKLPVYLLTADVEAQKNYREQGFSGLVLKPLDLSALKTLLNDIGRQYAASRGQ